MTYPFDFNKDYIDNFFSFLEKDFSDKLLQYFTENPDAILAGSLALMFWSIIDYRNPGDIDIIRVENPNNKKEEKKETLQNIQSRHRQTRTASANPPIVRIENNQMFFDVVATRTTIEKKESSSYYDDDTNREEKYYKDIKMCIFTSYEKEKYEIIEYNNIKIKIGYPENIINAKIKYTKDIRKKGLLGLKNMKKNYIKHLKDIVSYTNSDYYEIKNKNNNRTPKDFQLEIEF